MLTITYALDRDTGLFWSRVENHPTAGNQKIAVPILDYEAIGAGGDFTQPLTYNLERMGIEALIHARLKWTRKAPSVVKDMHRAFWGLPPLRPGRHS